ncbi:MAG: ABC-three component system middle component 6 [Candidatus Thorarchaeota archaeon]|jgi:hypothetical protein
MILPDKNLTLSNSLIGRAALMQKRLKRNHTVSSLWDEIRNDEKTSFSKFVLTLDFLFILGLIHIERGILKVS